MISQFQKGFGFENRQKNKVLVNILQTYSKILILLVIFFLNHKFEKETKNYTKYSLLERFTKKNLFWNGVIIHYLKKIVKK